ncbi:ATPase inhibitor subunit zeta, partial [Acinetobacter baumannii]
AASDYAKEVVAADFEEAGDADVLRKVAGDLAGKGVSEAEIRAKMGELMAVAAAQVKSGQ